MTSLTVLVILSAIMLSSAAPTPGIHIHSASYEVHPPLVHHVPVYPQPVYHTAVVAPVVHAPVVHAPVVHTVPYHSYVHPVAYKVKTHYHLFGK